MEGSLETTLRRTVMERIRLTIDHVLGKELGEKVAARCEHGDGWKWNMQFVMVGLTEQFDYEATRCAITVCDQDMIEFVTNKLIEDLTMIADDCDKLVERAKKAMEEMKNAGSY